MIDQIGTTGVGLSSDFTVFDPVDGLTQVVPVSSRSMALVHCYGRLTGSNTNGTQKSVVLKVMGAGSNQEFQIEVALPTNFGGSFDIGWNFLAPLDLPTSGSPYTISLLGKVSPSHSVTVSNSHMIISVLK